MISCNDICQMCYQQCYSKTYKESLRRKWLTYIRSDLQGRKRWRSGTVYGWNRLVKGYSREYTKGGSSVFQGWSTDGLLGVLFISGVRWWYEENRNLLVLVVDVCPLWTDLYCFILPHWVLVTHIREQGHYWCRQWRVACWALKNYRSKCWLIPNWSLRTLSVFLGKMNLEILSKMSAVVSGRYVVGCILKSTLSCFKLHKHIELLKRLIHMEWYILAEV